MTGTPAPWDVYATGLVWHHGPDGSVLVAECRAPSECGRKADAVLIASAPALLELADKLLSRHQANRDMLLDSSPDLPWPPTEAERVLEWIDEMDTLITNARAVIARARGEKLEVLRELVDAYRRRNYPPNW